MSKLADYNPIAGIRLSGAEITNPTGVIAVVGPNSSGKTLFLTEIETYLLTGEPKFVVSTGIKLAPPKDPTLLLKNMVECGSLRAVQGHGSEAFQVSLPYLTGNIKPGQPNQPAVQKAQFMDAMAKLRSATYGTKHDNFHFGMGRSLVSYLSLEARRDICTATVSFHHSSALPLLPLQGLQIASEAQEMLEAETGRVFGNVVWLDSSENNKYQLRTTGTPAPPSVPERVNPLKAMRFFTIDREGDGIQSYVGICISMLLGLKPVLLIDEPEVCLHPPQAYQIGRFIGSHASRSQLIIVATHSSQVLRGLLETTPKLSIVRFTHPNQHQFCGHLLPHDQLDATTKSARVRTEAIFDGAFARGVALVEGEGDREVYQAACDGIPGYPAQEVHFVDMGGNGFGDACRFYAALRVPFCVITDLDTLADPGKLAALLPVVTRQTHGVEECVKLVTEAAQAVKALPPTVTESQAKSELEAASKLELDWSRGDDNGLRRKLSELLDRIKRLHTMKKGGVVAFSDRPDVVEKLHKAILACRAHGVFLAPVGELEGWVPALMAGENISLKKPERALVMAQKIRAAESKSGDVWEFVACMLDYLRRAHTEAFPTS